MTKNQQREILLNSDLTSTERFVFMALALYADENNYCWPSLKQLAQITHLHIATVSQVLGRLRDKGFIIIERRWKKNFYRLKAPQDSSFCPRQNESLCPQQNDIRREQNDHFVQSKMTIEDTSKKGTYVRKGTNVPTYSKYPEIEAKEREIKKEKENLSSNGNRNEKKSAENAPPFGEVKEYAEAIELPADEIIKLYRYYLVSGWKQDWKKQVDAWKQNWLESVSYERPKQSEFPEDSGEFPGWVHEPEPAYLVGVGC